MAGEDEPDEAEVDGVLELFGLSVKSLAEEAIARRCAETGVKDPGAAAEAEWAVRRTVASTQSTVKSKVGFGRCCIGLHGTALHVASR